MILLQDMVDYLNNFTCMSDFVVGRYIVIKVISPRLRFPFIVGNMAILKIRECLLEIYRGIKVPLVQIPYPIVARKARFLPVLSRRGGRQRHTIDSKKLPGPDEVSILVLRQGHCALLDFKEHRKRMSNVDPTGEIGPLCGKSGPETPVQEFAYTLFHFLQAGDVLCVTESGIIGRGWGQKVVTRTTHKL